MSESCDARPIIRWAGSKKRLLPQLVRSAPRHFNQYLEPFAGSACVFFRLNPERSIVNDLNRELIDFCITSSNSPSDVYNAFIGIERTKARYYTVRDSQEQSKSAVEKAADFLYLNRNCFNGIYRVNKAGKFNVPYSDSRVAPYPSRQEFLAAARSLKRSTLRSVDFEQLCEDYCQPGDFIYLDPPYYIPKIRIFREYNQTDFTEADTQRLIDLLQRMSARGAKFLLSYPKGDLTEGLSKQWNAREVKATRSIASSASARRSEIEVLIANYEMF